MRLTVPAPAVPEKPLEPHPAVSPLQDEDIPLDPEVAPPPSEQPRQ